MKHNLPGVFTGICLTLFSVAGCHPAGTTAPPVSDSLKERCIRVLKNVMADERGFVKVHAAEYLIGTNHADSVQEVFLGEERQHGSELPYRIGIWRVLARAAHDKEERERWTDSIRDAFLDVNGKDRVNAVETLAKLQADPAPEDPGIVKQAMESENSSLALYVSWAASGRSADSLESCKTRLLTLLMSGRANTLQRLVASYIIRHIRRLNERQWEMLSEKALAEPATSVAKAYMLGASYVTAPQDSMSSPRYKKIKAIFLEERRSPYAGSRTELANVLAEKGTAAELPVLIFLLNNKDPLENETARADVRAAAAYAILKIGERGQNDTKNVF